jgi:transposase-like protein
MWALMRELFDHDKDASAEFMHGVVTREWASSKELTHHEVMEIITAAQAAAVKP